MDCDAQLNLVKFEFQDSNRIDNDLQLLKKGSIQNQNNMNQIDELIQKVQCNFLRKSKLLSGEKTFSINFLSDDFFGSGKHVYSNVC